MKKGLIASVTLVWLTVGGTIPKAEATAVGAETWEPFTLSIPKLGSVTVPKGVLTHVIVGNGYDIDQEWARATSLGSLCDASVRFTYGVKDWPITSAPIKQFVSYIKSDIARGCFHSTAWWGALKAHNIPRGRACVELYVYGWIAKLATQCHYIEG